MPAEVRGAADVVTDALRKLNVIAGDQEAEGFEADNALATWEAIVAWLASEGEIDFPADEIPLEIYLACVQLLADHIAASKGRKSSYDPEDENHPSRARLRKRMSNADDGEVIPIQPF